MAIKVENIDVWGFEHAVRGMRNPMNSWDKSDSYEWFIDEDDFNEAKVSGEIGKDCVYQIDMGGSYLITPFVVGKNDLALMKRLYKAGPEHRKYLRQIFVSMDITAPLYWWKEFDTYKVGTTANSTSTMHPLCKSPITKDKFAFDDSDLIVGDEEQKTTYKEYTNEILDMCEDLRKKYCLTNNKQYWRALVQILPEAFLQTRTVTLSYANLRNIYFQRRAHKLTEWRNNFIEFIKSLPYAEALITLEDENENTETD